MTLDQAWFLGLGFVFGVLAVVAWDCIQELRGLRGWREYERRRRKYRRSVERLARETWDQ